MHSQHDATIHALYVAFYGRPADPVGLAFWSAQLARADGRLDAVVEAFATSEEASVRFGGLPVAERIVDTYQLLFDRAPDAAGLAFWVDAVDSGRITLAALTLHILEGAQGGDATLVDLRLQAAREFTAALAASQADFSGYAAIEASRALVAAVDAEATPEQIAALVALGLSLSKSAHDAPQVLDLLGVDGQLAPLFDGRHGEAEPEALLQLLAGLAGIAADDPAALRALLRDGGVEELLDALPRGVSVADLAEVLAEDGPRAAAGLVYPRPPTPTPEPEPEPAPPGVRYTFEHGVLTVDGAASAAVLVDLSARTIAWDDSEFTLDGAIGAVMVDGYAGAVSLSGTVAELGAVLARSANLDYLVVDAKTALFSGQPYLRELVPEAAQLLVGALKVTIAGTLSIEESNLLDALPGLDPARLDVDRDLDPPAAGRLRFDGLPPVADDVDELLTNRDSFTLRVEGAEEGATIRYQIAQMDYWVDLPDAAQAGLRDDSYMYRAVVTDAAGNISYTELFIVTIDTVAPAIRTIDFGVNDGLLARGERVELTVVFDAPVTVAAGTVLHLNNGGRALYQSGSDSTTLVFSYTPAINQSVALLGLAPQAALDGSILDRAGNALSPSAFDGLEPAAAPRVDADRPGPLELRLDSDTGSDATDGVTANGKVVVSGLETAPGTRWQYKLDTDADWRDGGQIDADGRSSLTVSGDGMRVVTVRQFDAAGNEGPYMPFSFNLDTQAPTVYFDQVEGAAGLPDVTPLATADVVFRYEGELRSNDQVFMRIGDGQLVQVPLGAIDVVQRTITLHDVDVAADPTITLQVRDVAGNPSAPVEIEIDGMHGAPVLALTPTPAGLEVTSAVDGTLFLRTEAGLAQLFTTDGIRAGRPFAIGAQADELRGEVVVRTLSGDEYTAPGGEYVFGSAAGEELSASAAGGHLWGFGGNDTLLGGAGNDWLYGGGGTNVITGGRGADRIDLTEGGNTVHFSAGDSNNGVFDTLVFDGRPGGNTLEQWLSFDVSVSQVRSGNYFPNPVDDSPQALMDAINAGYKDSAANPRYGALITTFHNGETWLAVDTGNAIIDGNDYLVQLVGTVPSFEMVSNGDIWLRVSPA